jgi:IclR family pca regulon transcriptional regulator
VPGQQLNQSLIRGLNVIKAFSSERPALTLTDVAEITELDKATARRFLLTLIHEGYVRQAGRLFALTPKVLEIGFRYLSALSIPEIVQPHLESLTAEIGEATTVAILDGWDMVWVAGVSTGRIMQVGVSVGTRYPAQRTAMGRVLLASRSDEEVDRFLKWLAEQSSYAEADRIGEAIRDARDRDYATTDSELEAGLRSIAVPIRRGGPNGPVVAAMNASSIHPDMNVDKLVSVALEPLRATAHRVGLQLSTVSLPASLTSP